MKPTTELPDDPALPALVAIRAAGLAGAIPSLGLEGRPVELLLCGYHPGRRATLEVRAGDRRFAVKAYAEDPVREAELYEALTPFRPGRGPAGGSREEGGGPRIPRLLAWDRGLRVVVISWLEGPTAHDLVRHGQGARAGVLAARWLQRAASLPVPLGPPLGVADTLERLPDWVATLGASDPALGAAAAALARRLAQTQPQPGAPRLVHGTFYTRHVLDLGDGPGVIDWHRFGPGPLELDAGMFLATLSRLRLGHACYAGEALRAERAFLAGTRRLVMERALAWHWAAALLCLAARMLTLRKADWLPRAHALLGEATRLAGRAAQPAFTLSPPALELVLRALATRPATPDELDQLRRLLEDIPHGSP